jgi:ribonucleoside-diphosphate reductase beta chain
MKIIIYIIMNRFCIFPIVDMDVWHLYKKQVHSLWFPDEIDFSDDYRGYMTLDDDHKHSLKMILAFFANSDGLVNFNIQHNLLNEFDEEVKYTYVFQMFMEQIHNETYSIMIETLIRDIGEKNELFNSIQHIPIIKKISDWGLNYSNGDFSLCEKLLVFICFEGIMFSGAFAVIFWLKKFSSKGKTFMNGLIKSNEFISRDEGMHLEFGVKIFLRQMLKDKIPFESVEKIISEAVDMTKDFNNDFIKVNMVGLSQQSMNQYTEYMTDRIYVMLGYDKKYRVENPFTFMDTIGMMQKTNFHESIPTEYQKAGICKSVEFYDDF